MPSFLIIGFPCPGIAAVPVPSLERFDSIFPFWFFMKFEDLNHGLAWIKVEDELLAILLRTDPTLLAILGTKLEDST